MTDEPQGAAEDQLPRFLAAVVDSTDDAVIGKSLDGTIVSWNPGAATLYGYAADEIVGRHISELVPADRQAELEDVLDSLRAGRRVHSFETVRLRKDGTTVDVSVTMSPVYDADGLLIGASAIARDITDVHRAMATVRRQATQLHDENHSYWELWQNRFDYIYVLFTDEDTPNPAPDLLTLVHEGERFQLYRVNKERTASGRR